MSGESRVSRRSILLGGAAAGTIGVASAASYLGLLGESSDTGLTFVPGGTEKPGAADAPYAPDAAGSQSATASARALATAAQVLPAGPTGSGYLGVYPPGGVLTTSERWFGGPFDIVLTFLNRASYQQMAASAVGSSSAHGGRTYNIGIPLCPSNGSLRATADGAGDIHFTQAAQAIVDGNPTAPYFFIRIGWEFNLTRASQAWSSVGHEQDYIDAFRHVVSLFRAVSGKFQFVWCPNHTYYVSGQLVNPELSYPGDDVVDVVGMDVYMDKQFDLSGSNTELTAFNYKKNARYGMQWQVDFAKAHGKKYAIDEWGANADVPTYIRLFAAWLRDQNYLYSCYWDSNSGKTDQLSGGQYPNGAAQFITEFKRWTPANIGGALVRWYDASTSAKARADATRLTAQGETAMWEDLSGWQKWANNTAPGQAPTFLPLGRNGRAALRFDGTDDRLITPSSGLPAGSSGSTILAVGFLDKDANGDAYAFSFGDTVAGGLRGLNSSFYGPIRGTLYGAGNDHTGALSWRQNSAMALWALDSGGNPGSRLWFNGGAPDYLRLTGPQNTRAMSGYVGMRIGTTQFWRGDVQAIVVLSRVPSQDEVNRLFGWAAYKFGLESLLPAGHPYKSRPPLVSR
ncbi:glycosyl hydrolase [Sphingomonas immobilis]|uniref:Glycosyl hydrolase n=1 Tax=Sphingomonas immobilis TaxID=3063997 RepID=A0ABT9A507_9SPHN|nr:glycosyl hydrolase [Sphingomonas sp. CA1-15]MDO7844623.1 glycosyl hydrolase [Sphingomonas sp. CA1-15]